MDRLRFPDAVANEKSMWEPLHNPDSVSSKLRRRLFRGEALYAADGIAAGATSGIVKAVTNLMQEWGFEFEAVTDAEGKKGFKLKNPEHVPTVQTRKPRVKRRPRAESNRSDPSSGSPVHDEIRNKLVSGEEVSVFESMQMGASNAFLRKEIGRLQDEGYKFTVNGHGPERTYKLIRAPKGARRQTTSSPALEKTPVHEVPIASTTAADMMFGELATPPPSLGGHLRVMGLMLNDDDGEESVSVVVKNGSGMWKARIEGFAEVDAPA